MERYKLLARAGIVALCVLFAGGLVRLNQISLTSSYPPFSSLRSDASGTKLLWEGLAGTEKVNEQRSYQPLEETHFTGCSVFYLGLRPYEFAGADESFLQTMERTAGGGNRLILGFTDDPFDNDQRDKTQSPADKRWNVRLTQLKKNKDILIFVDARGPWQPVLVSGSPIAFERAFGAGTVVLLPHVSRISNAALAKDEQSRALIPALVGNNNKVVFDETHLGIAESGSIAGLARKYHLGGFLAGLLMLAGAFLWNRSVAFPPIPADSGNDNTKPVAGNDTRSTLVNLLSHHIPSGDLIKICIAEWNRTHPDRRVVEDNGAALKDPALLYRSIQETLQNEKTYRL